MKATCDFVTAYQHCEHCIVGDAPLFLDVQRKVAAPDHLCHGCGGALCRSCAESGSACRCEPIYDEEEEG